MGKSAGFPFGHAAFKDGRFAGSETPCDIDASRRDKCREPENMTCASSSHLSIHETNTTRLVSQIVEPEIL